MKVKYLLITLMYVVSSEGFEPTPVGLQPSMLPLNTKNSMSTSWESNPPKSVYKTDGLRPASLDAEKSSDGA